MVKKDNNKLVDETKVCVAVFVSLFVWVEQGGGTPQAARRCVLTAYWQRWPPSHNLHSETPPPLCPPPRP